MREGRSCYDHLAGRLGVTITARLEQQRWIVSHDGSFSVGDRGAWTAFGIDPAAARHRPVACHCLDWTERENHLAGYPGSALFHRLLERKWVEPRVDNRSVRVMSTPFEN